MKGKHTEPAGKDTQAIQRNLRWPMEAQKATGPLWQAGKGTLLCNTQTDIN